MDQVRQAEIDQIMVDALVLEHMVDMQKISIRTLMRKNAPDIAKFIESAMLGNELKLHALQKRLEELNEEGKNENAGVDPTPTQGKVQDGDEVLDRGGPW